MNPQIALILFAAGILGLFALNRDRKDRTSKALWIPVIWLMIGGSRNVAEWFNTGPQVEGSNAYLEGNQLDRNVLGMLLACGIIVLIGRRKRTAAFFKANAPILLFVLYCGISLLWSEYPLVGFRRWFRLLGDIIMMFVIFTESDSWAATKRVFARVGFFLIPLSLMLIRYFPEMGRAYGVDGSLYWTGVAEGKNTLGVICLTCGLGSMWRVCALLKGREGRRQFGKLLAHGALLGIVLWLFIVANSMTSLSCFLLGSLLIMITTLSPRFCKPVSLNGLLIAAVCVPVAVLFLGVGGEALQTMGRDPTLTGRTHIWQVVLPFVTNPLLGAGYEGFWVGPRLAQIARLHTGMNQAHNGYIEIYLNLGLIGLALLALVIAAGYRNVVVAFRREPNLASLKLALLGVALVYNCTEGAFKFMYPMWDMFLFAVMVVPTTKAWSKKKDEVATALPSSVVNLEVAPVAHPLLQSESARVSSGPWAALESSLHGVATK